MRLQRRLADVEFAPDLGPRMSSPAATIRIASTMSRARVDSSRSPLAPARSASYRSGWRSPTVFCNAVVKVGIEGETESLMSVAPAAVGAALLLLPPRAPTPRAPDGARGAGLS